MIPYSLGIYHTDYFQDKSVTHTRLQRVLLLGGLVLVFTLPFFCPSDLMILVNMMGISIIAVLGVQILTGYCGIITFGQAGFMSVGAYASLILGREFGFSFWEALPCAALAAGLMGLMFGLVALRMRGFYLVIATLAAGLLIPGIFSSYILPYFGMYGVGESMPSFPTIGGIIFDTHEKMWFIILFFVVLMTFFAINFRKTKLGRAFCSVRDNELSSEVLGVNTAVIRLFAFFICCVFAGVAGSLYAYWIQSLSIEQFSYQESIYFLGMVIIGGMGSIPGVFVGAVIIRGIGHLVSLFITWGTSIAMGQVERFSVEIIQVVIMHAMGIFPLLIGFIILFFIIFAPGGIMQWWNGFKTSYRVWPLS